MTAVRPGLVFLAAYHEKADVLVLLEQVPSLFRVSGAGDGSLMTAARCGQVAVIEALVRGGYDVNASSSFGRTPLHVAAGAGKLEAVRTLLDLGADPNIADDGGQTATSGENSRIHKFGTRA